MQSRTRIDLGVAAACIVVGAVFALEAWRIDPRSYEAVGPRFAPLFLAGAMVVGGALVGLTAWLGDRNAGSTGGDFGFEGSDLRRVLMVIGTGAVGVAVFWAAGYMASVAVVALLALLAFGVRAPVALVAVPLVAAIAYQFVFMGLMGLLDVRGAWVDLRPLGRAVNDLGGAAVGLLNVGGEG